MRKFYNHWSFFFYFDEIDYWPGQYPTYTTTTTKPTFQWPPPVPTHSTTKYPSWNPPPTTKYPSWSPPTTTKYPSWTPPTTTKYPSYNPVNQDYSPAACGAKNGNQDQERIVGGQTATPYEWPWVVALFNGNRQFCGGSCLWNILFNFKIKQFNPFFFNFQ